MLTALVLLAAISVLLLLLISIFLKKINDNLRSQTEVLHARLDEIRGAVIGGFGHVATEFCYGELNESLKAIGEEIRKLNPRADAQRDTQSGK